MIIPISILAASIVSTNMMPLAVPPATNLLNFQFRLKAVNAAGTSPPTPIVIYAIAADQFDSIPLRWDPNPPSDQVTNYIVDVSTNNFVTYSSQSYGLAVDVPWPFYFTNFYITIDCPGTGTVSIANNAAGPWTVAHTNFHGNVGKWTNSFPPFSFARGPAPGLYIQKIPFN